MTRDGSDPVCMVGQPVAVRIATNRRIAALVRRPTQSGTTSDRFAANYDVASFSSSDTGTGSPWSGAIVFTSSFKRWMFRYKFTLFAW